MSTKTFKCGYGALKNTGIVDGLKMERRNINMEEQTPINEETTVVEETVAEEATTEQKPVAKPQSFVKIREQKAVEKTTSSILQELGVKDIEEAKTKLAKADEALDRITKLEQRLESRDYEDTYNNKVNQLVKLLEKENVFDAEALVNYIDVDKVDLDKSGKITDTETIINQLKERKPNYFGKDFVRTDTYSKSNSKLEADPYKQDYENKNYENVIATYLRNNKGK